VISLAPRGESHSLFKVKKLRYYGHMYVYTSVEWESL
jgi:hypothetical protein